MKTTILPFNLETAEKILAGINDGKIKTKSADDVHVVFIDKNAENCPKIAAVFAHDYGSGKKEEHLFVFNDNGVIIFSPIMMINPSQYDLVLEVPDNEPQESQFMPYQMVLVRDSENGAWSCALFSHESDMGYNASGLYWNHCIPYEGNEHLVGTTNKPKED